MKVCMGCKYAEWKRAINGNLHPSGEGKCKCPIDIKLPNAFYFQVFNPVAGGEINRHHEFSEHCPFFSR